ncbi:MAG: hypothetical protein AAB880_02940 [Patescibacteria group bacterium]
MLIYSAHIPHSPALLRNISRSKIAIFRKTKNAIAEIADDVYARKIESIVFITPAGRGLAKSFAVQVARRHKINLGAIGDFHTAGEVPGNPVLAHVLVDKLCLNWPIKSAPGEELDAATSAGILQLRHKDSVWSALPVNYALLPARELYNFGAALRDVLEVEKTRVALISLGDLSRTKEPHHAQGAAYDEELINALKDKKTDFILGAHFAQADPFHVGAWRPLAVVLGALSEINYQTEILSYQQRLGVGMAVVRFVF